MRGQQLSDGLRDDGCSQTSGSCFAGNGHNGFLSQACVEQGVKGHKEARMVDKLEAGDGTARIPAIAVSVMRSSHGHGDPVNENVGIERQ